jgi:nitrogen regulatory protein P-II
MIMKMLTLICREGINDEILAMLNGLHITGFTVISGVLGSGVTGTVTRKVWTDKNTLYLIALDDAQMVPLMNAVRELHARLVQEHAGHNVRLKAFVHPCEVVV